MTADHTHGHTAQRLLTCSLPTTEHTCAYLITVVHTPRPVTSDCRNTWHRPYIHPQGPGHSQRQSVYKKPHSWLGLPPEVRRMAASLGIGLCLIMKIMVNQSGFTRAHRIMMTLLDLALIFLCYVIFTLSRASRLLCNFYTLPSVTRLKALGLVPRIRPKMGPVGTVTNGPISKCASLYDLLEIKACGKCTSVLLCRGPHSDCLGLVREPAMRGSVGYV
jgi:hypothetical protein